MQILITLFVGRLEGADDDPAWIYKIQAQNSDTGERRTATGKGGSELRAVVEALKDLRPTVEAVIG